jgi:hypothetical protein
MKPSALIGKAFYGLFFLAATTFVAVPPAAQAQSPYAVWRDRRAEFEKFMNKHPKASTELRENPQLAYDRKWLKKHPEVDKFFKRRPELREAVAYRPHLIYGSYDRYDRRHDRWSSDRSDRRDGGWGWHYR